MNAWGTPYPDMVGSQYSQHLPIQTLCNDSSQHKLTSRGVMVAPASSSSRPGSAPPQASQNGEQPRSPPAAHSHLPFNPSPLSPHARRLSTETQSRSTVNSALQQVSSQLQTATTNRKGKGRVLGIQERLRKEVDGVVKRRQGGVLARG